MKRNEWITIIVLMIVIAAIVAYVTGSITGNVIGNVVFAKSKIFGQCHMVSYKDASFDGKTVKETCKLFKMIPVALIRAERNSLFNYQNCLPSYEVYSSDSDIWKSEVTGQEILGGSWDSNCRNAKFADGSSNENYSESIYSIIKGVLCCKT
jgi:hypothetical protein